MILSQPVNRDWVYRHCHVCAQVVLCNDTFGHRELVLQLDGVRGYGGTAGLPSDGAGSDTFGGATGEILSSTTETATTVASIDGSSIRYAGLGFDALMTAQEKILLALAKDGQVLQRCTPPPSSCSVLSSTSFVFVVFSQFVNSTFVRGPLLPLLACTTMG